MSATSSETEGDLQSTELESPQPLHFKQEVVIKGLRYIFEGDIPVEPADFVWSVSVPNWEEQKPAADEMMRTEKISAGFDKWLERHNLGNGKVGFLEIEKLDPPDNALAIRVDMVRTETEHLPPEFGYSRAEGVGSFLMQNLCTLADIKSWRVYLNPVDKGGKLGQGDIYHWYKRRGFDDPFKFPKEANYNEDMQRWPKEPDRTQAIASILQDF